MTFHQCFLRYLRRGYVNCSKEIKNLYFHNNFSIFKTTMNTKPPNILVFTGNDCSKLFKSIENNILKCVPSQNYLVYHLLPSEVLKQPWMQSTSLLVVSSREIDDSTSAAFEKYARNFGNILLICSKFKNIAGHKCVAQTVNTETLIQVCFKDIGETSVCRGKYSYFSSDDSSALCHDNHNKTVVHKTILNSGILIASEIYIDRDPTYIVDDFISLEYDKNKCLLILKNILTNELGLIAKKEDYSDTHLSPGYYVSDNESENNKSLIFRECSIMFQETETKLHIYRHNENNANFFSFDTNLYFSNLSAVIYGHSLVYFPLISSTMDVAKELSDCEGIVIVAGTQLNGKGRGANKWISPMGCAMFTLHLTLPLFTNLGQKLPLIQHMAALAVVYGIRNQHQYRDLSLKIKWPNDIYFDNCKIGGLIISSTIRDKVADVNIGWGINVANKDPTVCINDAIKLYNEKNSCCLPYLHIEEVIASTVSQMEYFIKKFQNSGPDDFFSLYYSYWLHSDQTVMLENLDKKGTIMGIDEYGFLIVKTVKGEEIILQPDGNRFDIIKNLIYSRN